jgi:uncharacterized protein (TIGR01244 family)
MKHYLVAALLAISFAAYSAQPVTQDDVIGPEYWGAASNVTHVRHLYFSEQPDRAALQRAKENGISTVINLHEPDESDWNEQVVVEQLGLTYINVPISSQSNTLDPQAIAAISAAVEASNGAPVLLHCSTGNRAAAWFAVHLVEDHRLSGYDALSLA